MCILNRKGFTVIELVIVIIILGILMAFAIPKINDVVASGKVSTTEAEMSEIVTAIIGDVNTGHHGFVQDMRRYPTTLSELYTDTGDTWNPATQIGWSGPYIETEDRDGNGTYDILEDAWGNAYAYNSGAKTITSYGADGASGGTGYDADIVATFN